MERGTYGVLDVGILADWRKDPGEVEEKETDWPNYNDLEGCEGATGVFDEDLH